MYLFAILAIIVSSSFAANVTDQIIANKTKRNIVGHVQNYGDNRPVLLYPESYAPGPIKPVFESEVPKQVAAQQVLYEFQQTPTNAFSNVHVNQYYQPLPQGTKQEPPLISGSESVATPVQHTSLVRHGQNFAQVQFQPLPATPQHIQTQQYIPGKYLYVNGKILYQPNQANPSNVQQHPNNQRPVTFTYSHPQTHTQKFLTPLIRQTPYRRFNPPQAHQLQQITKPMNMPDVTEEQNEEEAPEEEPQVKDEEVEEEEEDDRASFEEDDSDDDHYSKYSFDDDDHYTEDEEDGDNERESSKTVPKKHKKSAKPQKYSKSNNFKYSESFSTGSKYEKPKKKSNKAPKKNYKGARYSKDASGKPRIERIEGKQSQNVPVIHKQKMFREKWYVTKSTDDTTN